MRAPLLLSCLALLVVATTALPVRPRSSPVSLHRRRPPINVQGGGHAPAVTGGAAPAAAAHHDDSHGMSIFTLAINIVADLCPHGMLPLAYGMASEGSTGLVPALGLLLTFGSLSCYTLFSIARACQSTGNYSFRGVWSRTLSRESAWIIDVGITFLCFGCCIFYAAFIGDIFAALAQAVDAPALLQKRWVCLVGLHLFPLLPLCLMKDLSALQYSSFVGVVGILYTTFAVVFRSLDGSYAPGGRFYSLIDAAYRPLPAKVSGMGKFFRLGPGAISLMNMACVAFTTHYNGINYYVELKHRTLPRYLQVRLPSRLAGAGRSAVKTCIGCVLAPCKTRQRPAHPSSSDPHLCRFMPCPSSRPPSLRPSLWASSRRRASSSS